jgi:hypothetical protein
MGDRGVMSDAPPLTWEGRGHPHRCQAGHRWQHVDPTAVGCAIPTYDGAGNLPGVGPEDCPVCCGRDDVLVRPAHTHYCILCDGDWVHEGRCLEDLPAWCPWCCPIEGTPPTAARTGPHSHYCLDCGSIWRHSEGCSAPLEAVLPDCSGCLNRDERPLATAAARLVRAVRSYDLVRPLAMTLSLAACAFLAGSFVLRLSPVSRTSTPPIREQLSVVQPPRATEPPATRAPAPTATEREPMPAASVARVPQGEPPTLPRREPPALPRREGANAKGARDVSPRVPEVSPRVPPELPPPATLSSPVAESRAAEPMPPSPVPSPAPLASEPAVESPIQKPERLVAVPMDVPVTKPSIPGAPVGALGGAAGWEAFLESHPRQVDETTRAAKRSR